MDSSGTSDVQGGTKKRRHNVGKACLNCRRRKAKCDGVQPSCGTCIGYKDVCAWSEQDDGRKPVSRQYLTALHSRIKSLESQLSSMGQSPVAYEELGGPGEQESGDDEEDVGRVAQTMLHLHMGKAGEEVHYHGPTSAFALPSASTTPALDLTEPPAKPSSQNSHDYKRHLPSHIHLDYGQHTFVLDHFFRFYASWGMRATASLFHNDMIRAVTLPPDTPPVRFSYYSPLLHNIILAIALRFSSQENLREYKVRAVYAAEAEKHMRGEMARPTLATVQGLALMSSWHSLGGQHSTGWVYFGMAERLARSMGLHVDCGSLVARGKMSDTERTMRSDTFWNIYCQEQCWSVYIGRPDAVHDFSTSLPVVDTALDEQPWIWETTKPAAQGLLPQPSMYSTTFVETAKLAIIMQKVMNALYSLKSNVAKLYKDSTISQLALEIDTWSEQLPPTLVITGHSLRNALPHIIMLQLAKEWLVILLFRPYYRLVSNRGSASTESTSAGHTSMAVQRCDRSAARINSLLQVYEERVGLRYCAPTLIHIAFTAGTTHLLAAVRQHTSQGTKAAMDRARTCCNYLRLVAYSWFSAEHQANILDSLVQEYDPTSPTDTRGHEPRADDSFAQAIAAASNPKPSSVLIPAGVGQPPHPEQLAFPIQGSFNASASSSKPYTDPYSPSQSTSFESGSFGISPSMLVNSTGIQRQQETLEPFLQTLFTHINFPPSQQMSSNPTQAGQAYNGSWPDSSQFTMPGFSDQSPDPLAGLRGPYQPDLSLSWMDVPIDNSAHDGDGEVVQGVQDDSNESDWNVDWDRFLDQ